MTSSDPASSATDATSGEERSPPAAAAPPVAAAGAMMSGTEKLKRRIREAYTPLAPLFCGGCCGTYHSVEAAPNPLPRLLQKGGVGKNIRRTTNCECSAAPRNGNV